MKINSDLGYKPVIYSELTQDEEFWNGCKNCVNYEILMKKERKNCLCTAMLFVPEDVKKNEAVNNQSDNNKVNSVVDAQPEIKYNNEQESHLSV